MSGGFLTADLALAWPLAGLTTTGINYAVLGLSNTKYHCYLSPRTPLTFNPLTAKLFNLNFHPLEVVSR